MADLRVTALRRFALSITALTVVGHLLLGFEQAYLTPVVGVLAAYACELGLETLEAALGRRRPRYRGGGPVAVVDFLLPAHITGLACAMLLYGNVRLMPTVLAAVVAVSSKYVVRVRIAGRPRHVLNPSNIGIVTVLLLFPWVGMAPPYQFTERIVGALDWLVPLVVLGAGTMLNAKLTRKMPLIAAWVGGFAAQALVRAALTDIALVSALLPLTGVVFILFTNYMITDPGTVPHSPRNQAAFGLAAAATYGILVQLHIVFGMFFAVAIVCCLRGAGHALANAHRARPTQPVGGRTVIARPVSASAPTRGQVARADLSASGGTTAGEDAR